MLTLIPFIWKYKFPPPLPCVVQYTFCIRDNLGVVLDQDFGGEELDEPILEEGNVFNNNLP